MMSELAELIWINYIKSRSAPRMKMILPYNDQLEGSKVSPCSNRSFCL